MLEAEVNEAARRVLAAFPPGARVTMTAVESETIGDDAHGVTYEPEVTVVVRLPAYTMPMQHARGSA